MYDCLTTLAYADLSGTMATPVGRQHHLAKVDLTALSEEGVACGIPSGESSSIATDLAARILDVARHPAEAGLDVAALDARALDAVTRIIASRASRLLRGESMGEPPAGARLDAPRRR